MQSTEGADVFDWIEQQSEARGTKWLLQETQSINAAISGYLATKSERLTFIH